MASERVTAMDEHGRVVVSGVEKVWRGCREGSGAADVAYFAFLGGCSPAERTAVAPRMAIHLPGSACAGEGVVPQAVK